MDTCKVCSKVGVFLTNKKEKKDKTIEKLKRIHNKTFA